MQGWLLWFLLAIALFVGEMFTAGFWLACLAVGAAVAGIVGLIPGLGFVPQGLAFALSSIASMAGRRPPRLPHFPPRPRAGLPARAGAPAGQAGGADRNRGPGARRR